jgi:hypothetical protein
MQSNLRTQAPAAQLYPCGSVSTDVTVRKLPQQRYRYRMSVTGRPNCRAITGGQQFLRPNLEDVETQFNRAVAANDVKRAAGAKNYDDRAR